MSWYYSINDGAYESKYGQKLETFLDETADYVGKQLEPGDSYSIKSLAIHFNECDPIELDTAYAAKHFDKQIAPFETYVLTPAYRPIAGRPLYNAI